MMKRNSLILAACLCTASTWAQAPTFNYLTEFPTVPDLGTPLAMAADANGGIYYTLFSTPEGNETGAYYVADPLNSNAPENHILIDDGSDTNVPINRGFLGIAVDSAGNVYLTLETGAAPTSTVRKRGPAPDFAPVAAFSGSDDGIIPGGKRYNAIEVINDEIIAITTFDTLEFYSAEDFFLLEDPITGGETYQRDLAYNPNNHDIYLAKNRDVDGAPHSSANLASGGSPDNLTGYTITPNFIPQGGAGGEFGINQQLIEYDPVNNLIMIPNRTTSPGTMTIYDPSDTSTPVQIIDGSESPNGALTSPADSVAVQQANGDTLLYITDGNTRRILVYSTGSTSVSNWSLF